MDVDFALGFGGPRVVSFGRRTWDVYGAAWVMLSCAGMVVAIGRLPGRYPGPWLSRVVVPLHVLLFSIHQLGG